MAMLDDAAIDDAELLSAVRDRMRLARLATRSTTALLPGNPLPRPPAALGGLQLAAEMGVSMMSSPRGFRATAAPPHAVRGAATPLASSTAAHYHGLVQQYPGIGAQLDALLSTHRAEQAEAARGPPAHAEGEWLRRGCRGVDDGADGANPWRDHHPRTDEGPEAPGGEEGAKPKPVPERDSGRGSQETGAA